jgi:hypothetical protein
MITILKDEKLGVGMFVKIWKEELQQMPFEAFADNMRYLKLDTQTYPNWIKTWVAWNELASEDDIDNYYTGDNVIFMDIEK